jgi:hypothetical protein
MLQGLPYGLLSLMCMGEVRDTLLRHTLFDLIPIVIAHVGEGFDVIRFQRRLRAEGYRDSLIPVSNGIGDLMCRDQLMLMINSLLSMGTDVGFLFGLHRATIRASEGDLQDTINLRWLQQVFVGLLVGL